MSNRLRFGILGTGNIAGQFADGVNASERCQNVVVASRTINNARIFCGKHNVSHGVAGYENILGRDDIDAVYISLPNAMHHEWTLRALEAGKHVLCEKPLAATVREAEEMFAAAKANDRLLVEAFMYRAHPQTTKVVDLVRSGVVGTPKLIRTSFCFRVRNWQNNIRFNRELQGGALMDVGCYCVNFSNLIAGRPPNAVHAVARMHESGVDEQTSVVMNYDNGITAEFTCGMVVQADNTAFISGDEGYLAVGWPWKPAPPGTIIELRGSIPPRQDNAGKTSVAPEIKQFEVPNTRPLFAIEADAFASAVAGDSTPFMTESETLANTAVIESIRRQIGLA